ncbi:MAG: hypothetical protein ACI906_002900 [Candidatus Latescibacterota bacterium]|jgi:hypothetical protein
MPDVALADMRHTAWVEGNVATCDERDSRIDLNELFRRFPAPKT